MAEEFMPYLPTYAKLYGPGLPMLFLQPHAARCRINHHQELRHLKARGGVAPREALAIVKGVAWRDIAWMTESEAAKELERLVEAWRRANP